MRHRVWVLKLSRSRWIMLQRLKMHFRSLVFTWLTLLLNWTLNLIGGKYPRGLLQGIYNYKSIPKSLELLLYPASSPCSPLNYLHLLLSPLISTYHNDSLHSYRPDRSPLGSGIQPERFQTLCGSWCKQFQQDQLQRHCRSESYVLRFLDLEAISDSL